MTEKEEIDNCISKIKKRLKDKRMNLPINASVKEGYIKVLEILTKKLGSYEAAGIKYLTSTQSKSIAVMAVDFLNEECSEKYLVNIPIKNE